MTKFIANISVLLGLLAGNLSQAATSSEYALTPLSLTSENTPLVMLAMSNDEQLYYKAYSDYTDVDGDGVLDVFYKGANVSAKGIKAFDYAGYFDPSLCYKYDTTKQMFIVARPSISRVNNINNESNSTATIAHSCDNDDWSGNFLNWATMTRIDVMRHVLYGGKRYQDDTTVLPAQDQGRAVLEVSYVPNDVHSFAKVIPKYNSATDAPALVPDLIHIVPDAYNNASGITTCMTSNNGVPVLRIAKGQYPFWASKEGNQCNFSGSAAPSSSAQIGADLILRVEVCATEIEKSSGRCRLYFDGTEEYYKPVGLIQKFGEDARIEFGLITGSYHRNLEGGVVRSFISKVAGNEDPDDDEIDLETGAFNSAVKGIIYTLEQLKIVNHNGSKYTDCSTYKIDVSYLKNPTRDDRRCSNWGNPISEIYYEALRYFAGNDSPTPSYIDKNDDKVDTDFLSTLVSKTTWTNPLNNDNYCAKCSIILMSSGAPSYDEDVSSDMDGDVPGLDSAAVLESITNKIGDLEYGDFSNTELIASDGDFCVGTKTTGLSAIKGTCPDKPQSEGSYHLAGLAYHAHSSDTDLQDFLGEQRVNTYAIEMADSVPTFDFKVNGKPFSVIPACQSYNGGQTDYTYCSLNDVKFRELEFDSSGNLIYANIYVMWEDSQWGNDFDMDVVQRIDICTKLDSDDSHCTKQDGLNRKKIELNDDDFAIEQQIVLSSGGLRFRATYALSGSTSDGLHSVWTDKENGIDGSSTDFSWDGNSNAPTRVSAVHTVNTTGDVAQSLYPPLYLAAKYGGFVDKNNNNIPDKPEEWDELDNETGYTGSDGIPDNYYKVRNPNTLESQLGRVFNSIVERVASGSNAAVVANRASGNGSIYQALYYPKITRGDDTVTWVGQLHSLFVDNAGLIREDSDGDKILDSIPVYTGENSEPTSGDFIVDIYYDKVARDTVFQRYMLMGSTGDKAKIAIPYGVAQDLDSIKPIWNGARSLSAYTDSEILAQRAYGDSANKGRYVFTSTQADCDTDNDGVNDSVCTNQHAFSSTYAAQLSGYLGYTNSELTDTVKLINYVRGVDQSGYRSRQIDLDNDGTRETWRLGDIIHSTPLVVEKTTSQFDSTLSDDTYKAFRTKYENRRRMVYVGANDGMIHAFNGGFWNSICNGFFEKPIVGTGPNGSIKVGTDCTNGTGNHPVGAELWAYIPRAVLPHLKWQAEADYAHNFYVDGEPQSFDVRIFSEDANHPDGWGTILVVPMRQGGGQIGVDHDNDGDSNDIEIMQSSIIVLDITNPDSPPTLIAEITDDNLGLTLSKPALVSDYKASAVQSDGTGGTYDNPSQNDWYLVFGSGPYPNTAGNAAVSTSTQHGRVYVYDLVDKKLVEKVVESNTDTSRNSPSSFFVGFESSDWDGDGTTDAVYFGSVGGSSISNQSGNLFRWKLENDIDVEDEADVDPVIMLATGQPLVAKPTVSRSSNSDRWVHFGTGRFYVHDDIETVNQQSVYGIKEPRTSSAFTWANVNKSTLVNSGDIKVLTDGKVFKPNGDPVKFGTTTIADYDQLALEMNNRPGWFRNLTKIGTDPSGRSLREPLIYQDQLIFTEYLPSGNQCDVNGRSLLGVVSWVTGTAIPYNPLGDITEVDFVDSQEGKEKIVSETTELGIGEFSGVTVFETSNNITLLTDLNVINAILDGTKNASDYVQKETGNCVFVQSSTGEMVCRRTDVAQVDAAGRQSWRELEILF